MKVSTKDILGIKSGTSTTFQCDHPKQLNTARGLACYAGRMYPENKIKYSCSIDWNCNQITITANPIAKKR